MEAESLLIRQRRLDTARDVYKRQLQIVPKDASVAATTFYTVPLSNREILYDVRYGSLEHILSTEYVVLAIQDERSYTSYAENGENGYENFTGILERNGYEIIAQLDDTIVIYQKEN